MKNKLKRKLSPEQMMDSIMQNFEFERVSCVMEALDWRWGVTQGFEVPSQEKIKEFAYKLLKDAATQIQKENISPNSPFCLSSGGFKATAFKSKKGNVSNLRLDFIISEWEEERKNYE